MDIKAAAVLKVCYMGEFRRIPMEHRPSFDMVAEAVSNLYTAADRKTPTMKYLDEDGDLCTLVQATFSDFLTTARPPFPETDDINIRPLLKLQLVYETVQESFTDDYRSDNTDHVEETLEVMGTDLLLEGADTPRQQLLGDRENHQQVLPDADVMSEVSDTKSWEFVDLSPRSDGTEVSADSKRRKVDESVSLQVGGQLFDVNDEAEARAAVELTKQQCLQELREHLKEWLQSRENSSVRYEDWISEVHPENGNTGEGSTIDSRMYLEASSHRQIWNELAAGIQDLDDEERNRRFVRSAEERQAVDGSFEELEPSAPELTEETQSTSSQQVPPGPNQSTSQPATAGRPVQWKECAATWLAAHLPAAAMTINFRPRQQPDMSLEQKRTFHLLAEVLRESGPQFEEIARAASSLASGDVDQRHAEAHIIRTAARLPWEARLVYARALIACCPEVLVPILPPVFREMTPPLVAWTEAVEATRRRCCIRQVATQAQALASHHVHDVRRAAHAAVSQARADAYQCRRAAHESAMQARGVALRQVAMAHRAALAPTFHLY